MNKKYDFTQTGGFPFDQDVLNDLQNGILEDESAEAAILGALVIISGCVVTGGMVSNGLVAINGQILPFVGGAIGTKVIIVTGSVSLTYQDGSIRPSEITEYATFGDDGVQNNPWANFVQLPAGGVVTAVNSLFNDIAEEGSEIGALETDVTTLQTSRAIKLASGTKLVGDIGSPGTPGATISINFPAALANTNYIIVFSINSLSASPETDGISFALVRSKTVNGFTLYLHEPSSNVQDISIDWMALSL